MHCQETLQDVLKRHEATLKPGLGRIKEVQVKHRSVPFALHQKVEQEIKRLEEDGVIVPVKHSAIVPVVKTNGSVTICGGYKLRANTATRSEIYPLPGIEYLFASLAGGKVFSKLDLSHAYLQLPHAEDSQSLVTLNTHKGLYDYLWLPFGVSSAPALFQHTTETLLQGLLQVCVSLDDILVTGCSH